jgi:hypothetical protein
VKFYTSSRCASCGRVHEFSTPIPDVLAYGERCMWCRGIMRPYRSYVDSAAEVPQGERSGGVTPEAPPVSPS